jgi:beta-glucuronidase
MKRLVETGLIHNVDHRETVSLNGKWQIIVDPYENGYRDYRYQARPDGYFRNAKPRDKTDLVEYSFDDCELLNVPGDWNTQREDLKFYEGTIWYKKSFNYTKKPETRVFLYFDAINYEAIVFVNGQKVGEHEGGFTPFSLEITNLVQDGDNFIVVKANNQRRREAVPTVNTDWWNYGGLTRRVLLVKKPETFIKDYMIQLEKGSSKKTGGYVQLDGSQRQQKVTLTIPEAGIETTVKTDRDGYAEFTVDSSFDLWSPENPKLYDVNITAESDEVRDSISFRTIGTRGTKILLNGEPLFLRGVCIHEEAPFRGGRACSQEDAELLIGWAKEMNCNFVRLAHYPHNEYMTRTADRLGILVWSEIPVYWTILWENEETYLNAQNQLAEMIARDKNKASVILWSVANETPLSDARLRFLRRLVDHACKMDRIRLVTAAMERHYLDDNRMLMIDDPLGEHVDVFGCNEYIGWYDGLPEKASRVQWKTVYNKPVIMTEFGGGALYNCHGDALTRWTEEFQESVYNHQIKMLKNIPFLAGTTPWILMDFHSPRRHLKGIQDFYNRKGLLSEQGQRKKAFHVMKKFYEEIRENVS